MPTLHRLLEEAALKRPDGPAIRCDAETLTYEQLALRAGALARALRDTGVARGDRVAVWLGRTAQVPVAFYGTFAAGAVLVPIDPKSPVEQVVSIIQATGATHLVTEEARQAAVRRVLGAASGIRHVIGLEHVDSTLPCTPWSDVLAAPSEPLAGPPVDGGDPAYILHTSGSTGRPKLIVHTHASAMSFVEWAVAEYALTARDRLTNHSSHHTCFATFDFYAAARAAATTVMLTPSVLRMPASLSAVLEREAVTVWYSVPAALVQLSLRGDLESRDVGSLRWVLFAGESFPLRHLRRIRQQLPGARLSHVYGSTEVNVCSYYHLPPGDVTDAPLPIGRPCSTAEILVADDALQLVADGEVGELLVKGSTVMTGYWNEPGRNRDVLVHRPVSGDGPYFRTGDRGRRLSDGNLAFVARADRQVKIRGHRVELDEVEGALLSVESVEEAAVFTIPDGEGSSSLHAAIVVEPRAASPPRDWVAALRDQLPPSAIPATVHVMIALPRTATGKVDFQALRAALANQPAPP